MSLNESAGFGQWQKELMLTLQPAEKFDSLQCSGESG